MRYINLHLLTYLLTYLLTDAGADAEGGTGPAMIADSAPGSSCLVSMKECSK